MTTQQIIDKLNEDGSLAETAIAYYLMNEGMMEFNYAERLLIRALMLRALLESEDAGDLLTVLKEKKGPPLHITPLIRYPKEE